MIPSEARPSALSSFDVPNARELVVRSCEDCACPVSHNHGTHRRIVEPPTGELVQAPHVFELSLEAHSVLFNPDGNGGVVVVNTAGRRIYDAFHRPCSIDELVAAGHDRVLTSEVVARLVEQDLVHTPGAPPTARFRPSTELTAWLHVTNACNLRCPYCYVHKSKDAMDATVGRDAVRALVHSAVDHGFRSLRLKYAGGEASLNAPVLLELHDYATARCAEAGLDLAAVVLSNGVAIPASFAEQLKSRGIRIMISLDGVGAAHDAQRPTVAGKPSAARVLRTIDRLLEVGIAPHISITITSRNITAVAEVVRFTLARDLTFSFNFFRDNECAAPFADLRYEEQAMIGGLREAFAAIEERMPPWSVLGSVLDRGQLLEPRQRSCGVGDDYVVIDQNGGIAKCHMAITETVGHVRTTDPVLAIRQTERGIRNLLVEDKKDCRNCTWRHWCSGGCSLATFRATGRFDVKSPNCNIYKAIYPEVLRLEGLRILRFATSSSGTT